ncbi:type VII secretion protein EccB [Streptomyces pseudovenezuelae]|uniref:type VII secretion protein EccB n=1 Tax=Streptomyces pseudovenezuelae TaxID=67350 RepID=UPI002E81237B|nr:type VII secretion protein EccB [Streptomyces pseudovenezuelae]WUA93782.1 type VII secretion protein EccB [Streptomyces pseudovenezuelae]
MQSRRDQVQAHMFVMGRLTSSMLRADPDAPESPQGRTNRGVVIGVVIAVLISAGAFVLGLLKPGAKDSWQEAGTLVVSKTTGSRYLYLNGRLRPVRNYASARLLAGADMTVSSVGAASLSGTPHGTPVGIVGAPDALPAGGNLDDGPWQVCSGTTTGSTGTTLAIGASADAAGLPTGQALLVTGPDKADYLVWRGSKLRLDKDSHAREALGYGSTPRLAVSAAFLNSVPSGPDLTPVEVPDLGARGPSLGGRSTRIGEVFRITVPGSAERFYLLRGEGLVPLTATDAALLLGDPDLRKKVYDGRAAQIATLGADALSGHVAPGADRSAPDTERPSSPPEPVGVDEDTTVCVRVQPGDKGPRISVALVAAGGLGPAAQAPAEGLTPACVPVGRITVPPGGGDLVRALGASGSEVGGTLYLVTDTGMKYRVGSAQALASLGYAESQARGLPAPLLAMLPTGPDLTPEAAALGTTTTTAPRCGTATAAGNGTGGRAADGAPPADAPPAGEEADRG